MERLGRPPEAHHTAFLARWRGWKARSYVSVPVIEEGVVSIILFNSRSDALDLAVGAGNLVKGGDK